MSTLAADARLPQRERGHRRVAAILDAAASVFREKGYEAATMTEIAARSETAFGSLYRFFPSKETLADALLIQYAQRALDRLAALAEQAPSMDAAALADALVDFMLALQAERSFAVGVMDARGSPADKREQFRDAFRAAVTTILQRASPHLTAAQCAPKTVVLVHLLKGVAHAEADTAGAVLGEYRRMIGLYLAA
jgi:AcrR family transcriptional regulator